MPCSIRACAPDDAVARAWFVADGIAVAPPVTAAVALRARRRRPRLRLRHLSTALGALIVGGVLLAAILAPLIAPHDPFAQDLMARLTPPQWMPGGSPVHPFGTDQLGRDYLSRLIYGARISMLIGILTVVVSGLIGITLGIVGGYFGGRVDDVVMFVITCRLSIPLILVALTVVALVGSSLTVVVATLGLLLWDRFAVVARTTTMQVRTLDYIAAARAAGASRRHILLREVLPNIMTHLVVVATLEMALAILLEAALSFLGLGVPPPLPSWGLMIAEGKDYMFFSPWVIMIPGVALFVLVLGINLLGDGLGDLLGTGRPR
jgi:peptide/nickel transport system permease protein